MLNFKRFSGALLATALGAGFSLGCSENSSESGETAAIIEPLPYEFPQEALQKDAVIVELGEDLFDNINANWKTMTQRLVTGTDALLDVPELSDAYMDEDDNLVIPLEIACQELEADGYTIRLCDGGKGLCEVDANGKMKDRCEIKLIAHEFSLKPEFESSTSGKATANVKAALDTGSTGLQLQVEGIPVISKIGCKITYNSAVWTNVSGGLRLSLDESEPNPIHFELAEVSQGIYLGGINEIDIGTKNTNTINLDCGGLANFLLGIISPKTILGWLSGTIQTAVKDAIDKVVAQPCTWPDENEKNLANGACFTGQSCACFDTKSCKTRGDMRCRDNTSGRFVSLHPGFSGRVNVGQFLSSFGADPGATLDFSGLVGGSLLIGKSSANPNKNRDRAELAAVLGLQSFPEEDSYCVPPLTQRPPLTVTAKPVLDGLDDASLNTHQFGAAISEEMLNNALFQATRSGLLCLRLGSELSPMISSALFSGFVPSLAVLGDDLPMQLAVRPTEAPFLTFGTNQVQGGKISDPLATIHLNGVEVDFYAMIEGRMTRLFTLGANIEAPVALEVVVDEETQKTMVHPVLGSLTKMITFTQVDHHSELLIEDMDELGEQLSGLLGLADTILEGVLTSYPIPDIFNLRFSFDGFTGLGESKEGPKPYVGGFFSISLPDVSEEEAGNSSL